MNLSQEAVAEKIKAASANAVYPGDTNIMTLYKPQDPEVEWLRQNLTGKHWKRLLHELEHSEGGDLYQYHSFFSFSTADGYCFYLPAFLIACFDLKRTDTVGAGLLRSLAPPDQHDRGWWQQFFANRVKRLTLPQREAVGLFLTYHSAEVDLIEPATLSYWQQFVPAEHAS